MKAVPHNLSVGTKGETLAADMLTRKGYHILETNFKTRFCEIDIIARYQESICFIEVKTRTSVKKGLPREAVHHTKQQKIRLGAQQFIKQNRLYRNRFRFDVVEVLLKEDNTCEINHIENAFTGQ